MAASSFGVFALMSNIGASHADPAWEKGNTGTIVAVGSGSIQSVGDYLSGADDYSPAGAPSKQLFTEFGVAAGNLPTPLHSTQAHGGLPLVSFDAVGLGETPATAGCITTKLGGPSFDRPNGSSNGILALNAAKTGGLWEAGVYAANGHTSSGTTCTGVGVSLTGQVDVARSSRPPNVAGTNMTWIPFGHDAVTYAYYDHNTGNASQLTNAQLHALYTSATGSIVLPGGDTVLACIVQAGSGTRGDWEGFVGATDAQVVTATTANHCGADNGIEENKGDSFFGYVNPGLPGGSIAALPAGTDAVVPFGAANWMAQANGVADDASSTLRGAEANAAVNPQVGLGEIEGVPALLGGPPAPASGTNGTFTPNNSQGAGGAALAGGFYHSPIGPTGGQVNYGRSLNIVVWSADIATPGGNASIKDIFSGAGSQLCSATTQAAARAYGSDITGFAGTTEKACGDITTTGNN